ncbi:MAG: S-layer homology domain-containing protein, partial [Clostridia bacterium]|nr:S-layer homology domain-containing protein [Clostridia bacterium]
ISLPFIDIDPNAWSYDDIKVAVDAGIIKGASETEYIPGRYVTREEVGAMLGRLVRNIYEREERNILLNHQGEV